MRTAGSPGSQMASHWCYPHRGVVSGFSRTCKVGLIRNPQDNDIHR